MTLPVQAGPQTPIRLCEPDRLLCPVCDQVQPRRFHGSGHTSFQCERKRFDRRGERVACLTHLWVVGAPGGVAVFALRGTHERDAMMKALAGIGGSTAEARPIVRASHRQMLLLLCYHPAGVRVDQWREGAGERGVSRRNFFRAKAQLLDIGYVQPTGALRFGITAAGTSAISAVALMALPTAA